jgi:dienelactone hydrolase
MDLGAFSDLPTALGFAPPKGPKINGVQLLSHLGTLPDFPTDFQIVRGEKKNHEGVTITEISWSVGWGPRTQAYLLTPEGVTTPLPGALFLHSHDDVKEFGKEKLVAGGTELPEHAQWVKRDHYGNQAPANELAKRGFAVLAFDAFMWGSRRFPAEIMPSRLKEVLGSDDYENLAVMHESMALSKYLSLFGTTLGGLINFDDRVALAVAHSLPEFSDSISAVGLSGGGCRAIYLHATTTSDQLKATVSVGAMATYESLLESHIAPHSWMSFPHNLAAVTDWPGVAIIGAPKPLYVQYCSNDQLFTPDGMKTADNLISAHYSKIAAEYRGDFYPVKHSFTVAMQKDAFDWMKSHG